jgi:hypothetical protein
MSTCAGCRSIVGGRDLDRPAVALSAFLPIKSRTTPHRPASRFARRAPAPSLENPILDPDLHVDIPFKCFTIKNHDLSRKDWELYRTYVQEMKQNGFSAHETREFELEAWAADPNREPRKSTVTTLRLRVEDAR